MSDTLSMPSKEPAVKKEKTLDVELLHDVWLADPDNPGQTIRITTNTPVLDENGQIQIDKKTRSVIVKREIRSLPATIAKQMINEGKAKLTDATMASIL